MAAQKRFDEAKHQLAVLSQAHNRCPCSQFAAGFIALKSGDYHRALANFRSAAQRGHQPGWSIYFVYNALIHLKDDLGAFKILCELVTTPELHFAAFMKELRGNYPRLLQKLLESGVSPDALADIMGNAEAKHLSVDSLGAEFQSGLRSDFLLGRSVAAFAPVPHVRPVVVASVRKCGTHAVSAVCQHLMGRDRLHRSFVDRTVPSEDMEKSLADGKRLFVGHIERTPHFDRLFADAFVILCVRDPLTQCMSMAHHFLNPHNVTAAGRSAQLRAGDEAALHYALFGFDDGAFRHASFAQEYRDVALAWAGRADLVVKFEDLLRIAKGQIGPLDVFGGIEKIYAPDAAPADVEQRLIAGLNKDLSASYVKRTTEVRSPDWLPSMIDILAPGVRSFFGYGHAT